MGNLIKMDLYRMLTGRAFKANLIIVTLLSLLVSPIGKAIANAANAIVDEMAKQGEPIEGLDSMLFPTTVNLSDLFISPFGFNILIICVLISVISFGYADIANGFIKNIAGQLPHKGYTVISKFIVICFHNFIFMVCGLIGNLIGEAITRQIIVDDGVPAAVGTFFLKLLLLQSLCAVLLFFTTGVKLKTFATILGVAFSTGMLGAAYLGINNVISRVFDTDSIDVSEYAPDQLLTQSGNIAIFNALIVSIVISTIFLVLTYTTFNKKDVK